MAPMFSPYGSTFSRESGGRGSREGFGTKRCRGWERWGKKLLLVPLVGLAARHFSTFRLYDHRVISTKAEKGGVPVAVSSMCSRRSDTVFGAAMSVAELLPLRHTPHPALAEYRNGMFFIAANLHDNARLCPSWQQEVLKLVFMLEATQGQNVFVSVFESGSTDATAEHLVEFKRQLALLRIPHHVETSNETRQPGEDRIPFLAAMRNKALLPLYQSSQQYDQVLFLNDVFFCAEDVLPLLHQTRLPHPHGADMACSTDWIGKKPKCPDCADYRLYDVWVGMDVEGHKFTNEPPYLRHADSARALREGRPFQVFSCWNGMVSIDADVFQQESLRLRAARDGLECAASECELLARDLWDIGRGRVVVVPSSVVAYEADVFVNVPRPSRDLSHTPPARYIDAFPAALTCCPLPKGRDTFKSCFDDSTWRAVNRVLGGVPRAAGKGEESVAVAMVDGQERGQALTMEGLARSLQEGQCSEEERRRLAEYAIPPRILQSGKTGLVSGYSFEALRGPMAWMTMHPCHEYAFLDDERILAFIGEHYPQFEGVVGAVANGGELADFARYLFMYHLGGVYADLDTLPLEPVWGMYTPSDAFVVGLESDFESEAKSLEWAYARPKSLSLHAFASRPRNDVLWKVVESVADNIKDTTDVYREIHSRRKGACHHIETILKTGPGVFTDVVLANTQPFSPVQVKVLGIPAFSSAHSRGQAFYELQSKASLEGWTSFVQHFNKGSWLRKCAGNSMPGVHYDFIPVLSFLQQGQWVAMHEASLTWDRVPLTLYPPLSTPVSIDVAVGGGGEGGPMLFMETTRDGLAVKRGLGPRDPEAVELWRVPTEEDLQAAAAAAAEAKRLAARQTSAEGAGGDQHQQQQQQQQEEEGVEGERSVVVGLQGDGNLVVHSYGEDGSGWGDFWEEQACSARVGGGQVLWKSGEMLRFTDGVACLFAVLRPDGRLAIHAGASPRSETPGPLQRMVWWQGGQEGQGGARCQDLLRGENSMRGGDWLGSRNFLFRTAGEAEGKGGNLVLYQHPLGPLCAYAGYSRAEFEAGEAKQESTGQTGAAAAVKLGGPGEEGTGGHVLRPFWCNLVLSRKARKRTRLKHRHALYVTQLEAATGQLCTFRVSEVVIQGQLQPQRECLWCSFASGGKGKGGIPAALKQPPDTAVGDTVLASLELRAPQKMAADGGAELWWLGAGGGRLHSLPLDHRVEASWKDKDAFDV